MAKKKASKKTAGRATKKAAKKRAAARPKKATKKSARKAAPIKERRSQSGAERLRLRTAAPGFTVSDIAKSLAFYQDVLGFHPKERWMREGQLMGVEMVAGAVTFYLGQDDWKQGRDRVKGVGFRIYCTTNQDIQRLAEQIKARGVTLLEEVQDRPWGSRDFAIVDPDGFKITIST